MQLLYVSTGPELAWYDVDPDAATIARRGSVPLPANVQYAWRHRDRPVLYVVSSNGGPLGLIGTAHHLAAFRIAPDGALSPLGVTQQLRQRPLHVSLDATGRFVLTAYNLPSAVTVHRVEPDDSVGAEVAQPAGLDFGITGHQVLVTPSNVFALLPTRGEYPETHRREEPGGVFIYRFMDGVLSPAGSWAPAGGYGYGPRHFDFHPTLPLAYLAVERQNRIETFSLDDRTGLATPPRFGTTTLSRPKHVVGRQMAGAIHVHPNGRNVYVSNRSLGDGGEDNIAVFAIDPTTGEPRLIQNAATGSVHNRTFSIDPTGRLLVAASTKAHELQETGGEVRKVPAALTAFRIGADGMLERARTYEVDTGRYEQFWSGMA